MPTRPQQKRKAMVKQQEWPLRPSRQPKARVDTGGKGDLQIPEQ